jgi:outer membrane protein W
VGKRAGDLVPGVGAVALLPQSDPHVNTSRGLPVVGNAGAPALDLTSFVTRRLALDTMGVAARLPLAAERSLLGDLKLGNVQTWSPTLLLDTVVRR